jgi:hypothetical protein
MRNCVAEKPGFGQKKNNCKTTVEKKNIFGGVPHTISQSVWRWDTALPPRFFLHGCRVAENAEIIGKIKRGTHHLYSGV